MNLPMPPPRKLPMPPAQSSAESIEVKKLGCDRAMVRIGDKHTVLTRAEVFWLIGTLERVGATL